MSWIAPTFGDGGPPIQPPKKKSKVSQTVPTTATHTFDNIQSSSSCDWLEQYKPRTVAELAQAVHVKKINEFEAWLKQSSGLNAKTKYLLITGPSGCGKTTMVQTVCKSTGCKILEWITPLDRSSEVDSEFVSRFEFAKSSAKLFEDYLFRSSRYSSCLGASATKKLVLVKDFPNVFLHNPTTFQDILENFLQKCMTPVVFICSNESQCRKLFPVNLKASCQVQTLTLNPIPDQRLIKILKSIISRESKSNPSVKVMSDDSLMKISAACQGDLRSAIYKMYYLSRYRSFPVAPATTKEKLKKASEVSDTPTDKDQRIDFFHGVGRVLYPKKVEDSEKGFRFVHKTDAIVESFLGETNTFIGQLHENYPGKFGNVADVRDAADNLCTSDLLLRRWQERDIFAQYALSVAVQGLMVHNRTPQRAKFEAFKRAQTARVELDGKALELEGKLLFSELRLLDYQALGDVLPYARLLLPNLDPAQLEYLRKTSCFK